MTTFEQSNHCKTAHTAFRMGHCMAWQERERDFDEPSDFRIICKSFVEIFMKGTLQNIDFATTVVRLCLVWCEMWMEQKPNTHKHTHTPKWAHIKIHWGSFTKCKMKFMQGPAPFIVCAYCLSGRVFAEPCFWVNDWLSFSVYFIFRFFSFFNFFFFK